MVNFETQQSMYSLHRKALHLLIVVALPMAVFMLTAVMAPKANAWTHDEQFCFSWHGKYGGENDRCYGPSYEPLEGVEGRGVTHSACVDAVNTAGTLVASWACAPTNMAVGISFDKTRLLDGVVRNNVLNDTNFLEGWQVW
jgi:hypothetical protein